MHKSHSDKLFVIRNQESLEKMRRLSSSKNRVLTVAIMRPVEVEKTEKNRIKVQTF
jgi:hypothetical protein